MTTRLAVRKDLPAIVETLVRSFDADPVFQWMYPGDAVRPGQLRAWFELVTAAAFNHGHCYHVPGKAAAIWVPPDVPQVTAEERGELVDLLAAQTSEEHAMTVLRGFTSAGAHHPEEPPSMLLWYVAVEPGAQGVGLGVEVLRPVLERVDADGLAAYLHSTNVRNVPFYRRLGWQVIAEVEMPVGGPVIRPMWRPAATA
jgi:ribosomal protein S18 acetylase RimI-like enzyme